MTKVPLTLIVNAEEYTLIVEPHLTLLEVLRDELDLTGTKEGCGEGVCGSCTVLLEGKPVRACLTLALEVDRKEITTVEGLADGEQLDALQEAFIEHGSVQCGFCTAGMLMSAKGLLLQDPHPNEAGIRRAISGNVCRCTGYTKIVEAIATVAQNPNSER